MQQTEYLSLIFDVPLEFEEALQGYFLINHNPQGFEERNDGAFLVHIMKEEWTPENEKSLKEFILALAPVNTIKLEEVQTYKNTDWNAQWEAGIEPLRVTDELVIAPSWRLEEAALLPHKHLIVIDPKMSFGTGHHETTRLCLKMIEHIDCINKIILDLGSGTGILAIYLMMHGAKHAVAVDTDEWAFENSKENCKRNGYEEELIELRLGELSTVVKPQEYFEIIIANIHRNILLTIYDEIAAHQISNGILVLSGILEYDAAEITDQYEAIGYRLIERLQENEWVCLRFEFTKP